MLRRSPHDREILRLALPALGDLAVSMLAAGATFVAIALASLGLDWGIVGVWVGFNVLMAVRLVACGARFLGRRWARTGASPARARAAAA